MDGSEDGVALKGEVGPAGDVGVAKGLGAGFGFGAPEFFGDRIEATGVDVGDAEAGMDDTGVVDEVGDIANIERCVVIRVARHAPAGGLGGRWRSLSPSRTWSIKCATIASSSAQKQKRLTELTPGR